MKMDVEAGYDLDPKEWERRRYEAENWFVNEVAANSSQFVPFRQGTLRGSYQVGEDAEGHYVEWRTPYANYLYQGYVYVNPKYKTAGWQDEYGDWHGYRGQKVKSDRRINYHTPGTGDHWVERAEAVYLEHWQDGFAKIIEG